jgi:hypothetical protein
MKYVFEKSAKPSLFPLGIAHIKYDFEKLKLTSKALFFGFKTRD